ncbi:MAG: CaiB/BaiF CoA transferase family protein [Acidimicrobiales bacterium]
MAGVPAPPAPGQDDDTDRAPTPPGASALSGIRVIDLGTFISGPYAATLLADFGADVVKVELPDGGDPMRTLGVVPPGGDDSYWWSAMGRNKRSVALDVRTPVGREVFAELLATADVLIENFRPGTLDRWGLTPEWLEETSPGIIVVRISGYGQDGPWRDRPGFDRNAQAFSGLVYVTGEPDAPPQQAGLPVCDYTAGLWGAFGALVALLGKVRRREGSGNEVDLALYEAMIPFLKDMPMTFSTEGRVTERSGNTPDYVAPGGAYRTGDGEWVFVSGTGDRMFTRVMEAIGHPEAATAPEFRSNSDRVVNRVLIDGLINAWMGERGTEQVLAEFTAAQVPVAKIQSIADLMGHPQVVARHNFVEVPQAHLGEVRMSAPVPRMGHAGGSVRWAGQALGEATDEVLGGELGLSAQRLAELRSLGVLGV